MCDERLYEHTIIHNIENLRCIDENIALVGKTHLSWFDCVYDELEIDDNIIRKLDELYGAKTYQITSNKSGGFKNYKNICICVFFSIV